MEEALEQNIRSLKGEKKINLEFYTKWKIFFKIEGEVNNF